MLERIGCSSFRRSSGLLLSEFSRRPSQQALRACRECRTPLLQRRKAVTPPLSSIVDNPPKLVRVNHKHGPGLIILAIIPITAFVLGTWQVQRLEWKTSLMAKYADRLARDPLPLPPEVDVDAIPEFDYRKVYATGRLRHDREMLLGPRIHDGDNGFQVITPLDRGEDGTTVLVNRGWISKKLMKQAARTEGLPNGQVTVEGLLREPFKKNMFTPDNKPEKGEFYFPDVKEMAEFAGSQPVLIEETMVPELLAIYDRKAKGIPLGRPAQVNLRNNHAQYIFTWYALSAATTYMFWLVVRRPPTDLARRVRQNKEWA